MNVAAASLVYFTDNYKPIIKNLKFLQNHFCCLICVASLLYQISDRFIVVRKLQYFTGNWESNFLTLAILSSYTYQIMKRVTKSSHLMKTKIFDFFSRTLNLCDTCRAMTGLNRQPMICVTHSHVFHSESGYDLKFPCLGHHLKFNFLMSIRRILVFLCHYYELFVFSCRSFI